MNNKMKFKKYCKKIKIGFFEKMKFSKYIDSIGCGYHNDIIWEECVFDIWYLNFKKGKKYDK